MSESEEPQTEGYENWKRNIPFIYEIAICHELEWPSLTVQWLNDIEIDCNGNEVHRLIAGTITDKKEQDYLKVMKIVLPSNIDQDVDFTLLNNIWKTQDVGKLELEFQVAVDHEINKARCMPQNNYIVATQNGSGEISIVDLQKQATVTTMSGPIKEGYGLSWSPIVDGQLLSASYDSTVYLWDTNKECMSNAYKYHEAEAEDVCWHPSDPNIFVSCSDDKTFALCDTRTQAGVQQRIKAHDSDVYCVQFNPFMHNLLITGSGDSNAKLFDQRKPNKELHSFENHDDAIYSIQWSPHNKNIFTTGSQDNKVIIWDMLKIGGEIKAEDEHDGPAEMIFYHGGHRSKVNDVSWSLKHRNLIASVEEGTNIVQVWKMQSQLMEEDENDSLLLQSL